MYSIKNTVPDLVKDAADVVIENDRKQYGKLLKVAEEFAAEYKILIGGRTGISTLLREPIGISDYTLDLYTPETFDRARKLADLVHQTILDDDEIKLPAFTVNVESKIRHKWFILWVNARPVINLYSIGTYRGVPVGFIEAPMRFGNDKVLCVNFETQLISVYQNLYNPYSSREQEDYSKLLSVEEKLYNLFSSRVTEVVSAKTGGKSKGIHLGNIIGKVVKSFAVEEDIIFVGDYAINKKKHNPRLQIITNLSADYVSEILRQIVKKEFPKYTVTFVKYNLEIPSDIQLIKYTHYIVGPNKTQISLFDMYNSLEYETIPWKIQNDLKLAGDFVNLRFKLIEYLVLELVGKLSEKMKSFAAQNIKVILDEVKFLRKRVYAKIAEDPFDVFQFTGRSGVFVEKNVTAKKLSMQTKLMFTKYYPSAKTGGMEIPFNSDLFD